MFQSVYSGTVCVLCDDDGAALYDPDMINAVGSFAGLEWRVAGRLGEGAAGFDLRFGFGGVVDGSV